MSDAVGTWTDERVELLKKLWSEGFSASQIAAEMGGVTRNAVIGKVHRLGLSGRGKTGSAGTPRPRKPRPAAHPATITPLMRGNVAVALKSVPRPEIQPLTEVRLQEDVVVPLSERVTIMELREYMCRWPMGDPTTPDFRFCGARSIGGLPYCTHHARIAYQPAAERKRIRA
jgi:GcrA cell cycle regulator